MAERKEPKVGTRSPLPGGPKQSGGNFAMPRPVAPVSSGSGYRGGNIFSETLKKREQDAGLMSGYAKGGKVFAGKETKAEEKAERKAFPTKKGYAAAEKKFEPFKKGGKPFGCGGKVK